MRTACTYIKGDNMKSIKRISLIALGFLLVILSVFSAFAETIYTLDGYSYTVTDNLSMTLKDWDTSIDSNLSLPDTLANRYFTNIGNWAFENRTDLTGLDFSQSQHLTRIGYETFIGCSGIANDLVLPESLYLLNDRCFSGCSAIPSLTIKGNVTVIPTESFYGCSSLKSVVLPTTVKNIQSWAFGDCTELEYVEIPQNVTSIAISAFMNDPTLTSEPNRSGKIPRYHGVHDLGNRSSIAHARSYDPSTPSEVKKPRALSRGLWLKLTYVPFSTQYVVVFTLLVLPQLLNAPA